MFQNTKTLHRIISRNPETTHKRGVRYEVVKTVCLLTFNSIRVVVMRGCFLDSLVSIFGVLLRTVQRVRLRRLFECSREIL